MAIVRIPESGKILKEAKEIAPFLSTYGIWYRFFSGGDTLGGAPSDAEILDAYRADIAAMNEEGGYLSADVINISSDTPGLDAMLAKFDKEHWHDEDEVRFIVKGKGVFFINPAEGPIFEIEVGVGDMINVPEGTLHWFHLCEEREIRAIRLFKNTEGWTPNYSDSKRDADYIPSCFGPEFIQSESPIRKLDA